MLIPFATCTNGGADLLRLFAGGGVAGADGPERLVCNDAGRRLLRRHASESCSHLIGDIFVGQSVLALLQALSDADNRGNAVGQQNLGLFIDHEIVLAVVAAALAVADDAVLHAEIRQLRGGNLAGVRALLVLRHVLRTPTTPSAQIAGISGNGAQTTTSQQRAAGMAAFSSSRYGAISDTRLFSFQFPAMIVFLLIFMTDLLM